MLQKENQNENQDKAQYFSFNVIQKISNILHWHYLKKYENKIGIIYKGKDHIFMKYYENNEEVSSKKFSYISPNQSDDEYSESSSSSFHSYQSDYIKKNPYCFCGKLEYLYYIKQYEDEIVQCNLKNLICKTYNFEDLPLNCLEYIEGIKKTNYIIMSWIDHDNSQSLIEIRDSIEFQIKYTFKQFYGHQKVLYTNLQQSQIAMTKHEFESNQVRHFYIRNQKLFFLFSFPGRRIVLKITEMDNYLIIFIEMGFFSFKLASLILKGKILRKLYQLKDCCRIKKYQNTYLFQVKFQNSVSYQIYQWWNGKLTYSSKIKELLNGKITSRGKKAKRAVYILKYKPDIAIDAQLKPMIPEFQSPLGSCKEISSIQ